MDPRDVTYMCKEGTHDYGELVVSETNGSGMWRGEVYAGEQHIATSGRPVNVRPVFIRASVSPGRRTHRLLARQSAHAHHRTGRERRKRPGHQNIAGHILNRRVARLKGFRYSRIVPITRGTNSSHGALNEGWSVEYHASPGMMEKTDYRKPLCNTLIPVTLRKCSISKVAAAPIWTT